MSLEAVRIGIYIDGSFFLKMNNHIKNIAKSNDHIDVLKFAAFVEEEISNTFAVDLKKCSIVGGHFFRGRYVDPTKEQDDFYHMLDSHLYSAGITPHYIPIYGDREKGVDTELALTALEEAAMFKMYDVIALVAGDEDFVPLVRKIAKHGVQTVLFAFNNDSDGDDSTRTSFRLTKCVSETLFMDEVMSSRGAPNIFQDRSTQHSDTNRFHNSRELPSPLKYTLTNQNSRSEPNISVALRDNSMITVNASDTIKHGYVRSTVTRCGGSFGFLTHPDSENPDAVVYMHSQSFRSPAEYSYVSMGDILEYRLATKDDIVKGKQYTARDIARVVQ